MTKKTKPQYVKSTPKSATVIKLPKKLNLATKKIKIIAGGMVAVAALIVLGIIIL